MKKIIFLPYISLLNKNKSDSEWSSGVLSCEIIRFTKCSMILQLYPKMYEKRQKTGFKRNAIIPKSRIFFNSKIDATNLKEVSTL